MLSIVIPVFLVVLYVSAAVDPNFMPDTEYSMMVWYWLVLLTAVLAGATAFLALRSEMNLIVRLVLSAGAFIVGFLLQFPARMVLGASRVATALREITDGKNAALPFLRQLAASAYRRHWGGLSEGRSFVLMPILVPENIPNIDSSSVEVVVGSALRGYLPHLPVSRLTDPPPTPLGEGRAMFASVSVTPGPPQLPGVAFLNMKVVNARAYDPATSTFTDGRIGFSTGVSFGIDERDLLRNAANILLKEFAAEWVRMNRRHPKLARSL